MENEHDLFNDDLPFEFKKPHRDDALKERSRQDLLNSIATNQPRKRWRKISTWLPAFTACVLIAGLLVVFNRKRSGPMTVFQTRDSQRTITLPDSSRITLNRFSEVRTDFQHWSNRKREVWLTGEAFFEITKVQTGDSHYNNFIVHTAKGDIEVLGTSFNVQTDSLGFSTALHTGSIKAHIGKDEEISLVPGQMLIVQGNTVYKKQVNVQLYSAWKDGEFHFDNTSLTEVITLMERYYGLVVKVAEDIPMAKKKLSGNIAVKDSSQLINVLQISLGLNIQRKGDSLFITK
jgi:transmembrane sensor